VVKTFKYEFARGDLKLLINVLEQNYHCCKNFSGDLIQQPKNKMLNTKLAIKTQLFLYLLKNDFNVTLPSLAGGAIVPPEAPWAVWAVAGWLLLSGKEVVRFAR